MAIYWTLKDIPELANLPKAEMKAAWKYATKKAWKHWQVKMGLGICGGCAGIGSIIGAIFGGQIIGAATGGGLGGLIFSQIQITHSRQYVKAYLNEKNIS